jgi:Tuberculosis necrotizing toxin
VKLRHMSQGLLAMFAGGDPWKVNATLQSGRPAQIADLGQAFHNAGQSTQAADNAFAEARRRLDAWINDNGQRPINDSAEVQRTVTLLGVQGAQLPKIAVDLENIAGVLAQAQGTANGYIATLESRLQTLDEWIGQAEDLIKQDQSLLAQVDDADDISELEDDIARLEQYISDCEHEAIDDTKATLQQVEHVREGYSGELQKAEANLRTDGYDPAAIQTLDGEHTKDQVAGNIPPSGNPTPTLQDMLLPGGAGPGGAVPQGPPVPAGKGAGSAGRPPSLQDLLLPTEKAEPSGPGDRQPVPGSLPDLLSRLQQPGAPGAPVPQLKPADVESFKAMARQTMARDGVPPDQIEARLDEMVARTQQWIDNGMPNYVPPEPQPLPPPGFGEGFGDRWQATEQGIKNLIGQGGPGAPGVLESWEQMLKGTTEIVQNPLGAVTGEVKDALDSPSAAYYLGAKTSDGAFALPGLLFGGEGAAVRAGLPAEVITDGGAPLAVVRGWDATGGMSWDDFASQFGTLESRIWPGNDGFPPGYAPQPAQLPEGAIIDRFGSEFGRYLAPDGTPFSDRALAPESVGGDYNRYIVTGKSLPPGWRIVEGPVEPWYGQTPSPGTLQYMILGPDGVKPTVHELVRLGILDEYGPLLGR